MVATSNDCFTTLRESDLPSVRTTRTGGKCVLLRPETRVEKVKGVTSGINEHQFFGWMKRDTLTTKVSEASLVQTTDLHSRCNLLTSQFVTVLARYTSIDTTIISATHCKANSLNGLTHSRTRDRKQEDHRKDRETGLSVNRRKRSSGSCSSE